MKLSCLQENLKRGLAIVGHAVAGKSTLPVLSNILLASDDGRLKLAATNLEIGITCWIGAKIEDEGAVTVPAKLLSDVVSGLPNDKISLVLDQRTASCLGGAVAIDANGKQVVGPATCTVTVPFCVNP